MTYEIQCPSCTVKDWKPKDCGVCPPKEDREAAPVIPSAGSAGSICDLCGDTKVVEIIPAGKGDNDVIQDECPRCLRDEFQPGWR